MGGELGESIQGVCDQLEIGHYSAEIQPIQRLVVGQKGTENLATGFAPIWNSLASRQNGCHISRWRFCLPDVEYVTG